ncbi:MAG TPA: hypothetical protein PKO18_02900 [Chitinophagales bacterium]|nr:hypothetical protein [Chitinophagales bacterium]HNL84158.1 hypothetical protein [Chitinophagales bacterium]
MKSTKVIKVVCLTISMLVVFGCKKKDPVLINEAELITTVKVVFTDTLTNQNYTFQWEDLDGDGASQPIITSDTLPKNTYFTTQIELWNKQNNPEENITTEVEEEGIAHQFFYSVSPGTLLQYFNYEDSDEDGKPIGLIFSCKSNGTGGEGMFKLILRHLPDKFALGVSTGDITNANGETDVEIEYPFVIK